MREHADQQDAADDHQVGDQHGKEHYFGREPALTSKGHLVGIVAKRAALQAAVGILVVIEGAGEAVRGSLLAGRALARAAGAG